MRATLTDYRDVDRLFRDDTDATLTLSPTESRAELWLAWCALLPSKRDQFLAEQDDDARDWLLHQADIAEAVVMDGWGRLERTERAVA